MHIRDKYLGLLKILVTTGKKTLLREWDLQKQVRIKASELGVLYCQEKYILLCCLHFPITTCFCCFKKTLFTFSEISLKQNNENQNSKVGAAIINDHYSY